MPVVRATGGLNDTVEELDVEKHTGNGFRFNDPDSKGLRYAFETSMAFYNRPASEKSREIARIMKESLSDFNLEKTAEKYIEIYEELLKSKTVDSSGIL